MSKVLLFSDLHIHPHKRRTERLNDCLEVLEWVFDTAKSRNIDNIIFAGDLFHDRQKIDVLTYQRTFEIFQKKLASKIWILLGNHDLWHLKKLDVSSVFPLTAIPGVTVVAQPSTLDIAEHPISFLPYTHDPITDLAKIKNECSTKILIGHIAIDNAVWNRVHGIRSEVSIEHDGEMTKVGTDIFKDWGQVYLGHYHAEQKLDHNVEYIGSPLQLSFGEAFQHKHIIILDLETYDKEYIRNTFSPQHFIIPEADLGKYKLENNFIRVIVDDIADSKTIDMRNDITQNNNVGSLEIKQVEKKQEECLIENAKAILFEESKMLGRYVEEIEKHTGLQDLNKEHLLEIGKMIADES